MRWAPGTAAAEEVGVVQNRAGLSDVLPGSRSFLLTTSSQVTVFDAATGEERVLTEGKAAKYIPSGHIVYMRLEDNALLVQPFDPGSLSTTGAAVSTSASVRGNTAAFWAEYTLAGDGTLVYAVSRSGTGEVPVWVDRSGRTESIDWVDPGAYDGIALSPDGNRIAAGWMPMGDANSDIWIFDLRDRSRLPLTRQGRSVRPEWHPTDGTLLYLQRSDSSGLVMRIAADGSGTGSAVVPFPVRAPADAWWTRDGKEILLRRAGTSARSIFRFVPGVDDEPQPWLDREFDERGPAPSPDGHWLVYTSDQSGRDEVYAQPYPDRGAVVPVSIEGGTSPVWSRDGREIFFVGTDRYLWSARVSVNASSFRVESRERLFELGDLLTDQSRATWDVAPDGRFLFTKAATAGVESSLVLVRNWVQEATGAR